MNEQVNEELEYFDSLKGDMDAAFDDQIDSPGAFREVSNEEMQKLVAESRAKALAAEASQLLIGSASGADWEDRNLRTQALEAALRTNPIDPHSVIQTAEAFYLFLKGEKDDV
jgi:hypothetical protein